jgi:hypothetical protein
VDDKSLYAAILDVKEPWGVVRSGIPIPSPSTSGSQISPQTIPIQVRL